MSLPNADETTQTAANFGLINKTYSESDADNGTQWQRFSRVVDSLNQEADSDTVYKVLFMGRHGEGFHNAAESYYGTGAWNVRALQRDVLANRFDLTSLP